MQLTSGSRSLSFVRSVSRSVLLSIAALLLPALALTTGCSKPYQRTTLFVEAEYAPYEHPGTAKIAGQAFIRTRHGDVKYGAGEWVVLNPVTSYSKEWFDVAVLEGKKMSPVDTRIGRYQQKVLADGDGHFKFSRVPAGNYYVVCPIFWVAEASLYEGLGYSWGEGGVAYAIVSVREGETVEAVVTRHEDAAPSAAAKTESAATAVMPLPSEPLLQQGR